MLRSRDIFSSFTTSITHMLQPTASPRSPRSPHSPLQSTPASVTAAPHWPTTPATASTTAVSLSTPYTASPHTVQFHISPQHHGRLSSHHASAATSPSSALFTPARSGAPSGTASPRFHFRSPQSSKKRMSRSASSSSMQHADVASVTSRTYSHVYSPQHHQMYSHLYSHSSASSATSTSASASASAASSFSFHQPGRTYPSSSFLPAFASIGSPDSSERDLSESAPRSPSSESKSRTLAVAVGGVATSSLLPAYRTLQSLEAFPAPAHTAITVHAPMKVQPSLSHPSPPPPSEYPPSIVQITDDSDHTTAATPVDDTDEHDPELASLSSTSSFSISRALPSTPTLSRFRPARSPSVAVDLAPVARDDFWFAELDPREPLPVWHPSMQTTFII